MGRQVVLEIPEQVERDAREIAARTNRPLEAVLTDWLRHFTGELPVAMLPDEGILELCDRQMSTEQQEELSDLLSLNRENQLTEAERARLDELMQIYRSGMLRKAEAFQVAVQRGLRMALS
jgi:hypothetical protein